MPLKLYAQFTVTIGSDALDCQVDDIVDWAIHGTKVWFMSADGRMFTYEFDPRGDTSNNDFELISVDCIDDISSRVLTP